MHTNVAGSKLSYCSNALHLKLADIIHSILPADKIFLLGSASHREKSESIFYMSPSVQSYQTEYFLLVLCNDLLHRSSYEWQDKMESNCQKLVPVTILVSQTARFKEWLANGHLFARRVVNDAGIIMDNSQEIFMIPAKIENLPYCQKLEEAIKYSMKNAEEFISGADFFIERKHAVMAAFMLHQATEQVLTTILKRGTGYHTYTHNLERLIRLSSLVTQKIAVIFPGRTEREKQQFRLLQRAYSDSRYQTEYNIELQDLINIKEKVLLLRNLALEIF